MSTIVGFDYARTHLGQLLDEVQREHGPIYISRKTGRGAAVLLSQAEYEAKIAAASEPQAAHDN
jgi:prevent-host-death family protein